MDKSDPAKWDFDDNGKMKTNRLVEWGVASVLGQVVVRIGYVRSDREHEIYGGTDRAPHQVQVSISGDVREGAVDAIVEVCRLVRPQTSGRRRAQRGIRNKIDGFHPYVTQFPFRISPTNPMQWIVYKQLLSLWVDHGERKSGQIQRKPTRCRQWFWAQLKHLGMLPCHSECWAWDTSGTKAEREK